MITCSKCHRPFRSSQPDLVAEMPCLQTGNEKCRIATAAYQRGRADAVAWKPIAEAPLDGTRVVLASDTWQTCGSYEGHWVIDRDDPQWTFTPTHYMELPPPPEVV